MKLVRHSYFSDYYDANDSANKTLRLLWCALSGSAAIHFVCCCYCCCTTTTRCRRSITARYLSIYPSIHLSVHAIAAVDYDEWTTTKWNTCYDGGAAADIEPMKARILSDSLILLLLLLTTPLWVNGHILNDYNYNMQAGRSINKAGRLPLGCGALCVLKRPPRRD